MKKLFSEFMSGTMKWASFMVWMILILWVAYATVSYPGWTPSWQLAGWTFWTILKKMLVNENLSDAGNDWVVKKAADSDKLNWLTASDLSASTTTWWTDMFVTYWYTNCPTWWTKAYDWILEAIWNNNAQSNMNLQWNIWAQAAMSTVCVGSSRDWIPSLEYAHSYYWYLPVTNYNNYTKTMSCAVCIR